MARKQKNCRQKAIVTAPTRWGVPSDSSVIAVTLSLTWRWICKDFVNEAQANEDEPGTFAKSSDGTLATRRRRWRWQRGGGKYFMKEAKEKENAIAFIRSFVRSFIMSVRERGSRDLFLVKQTWNNRVGSGEASKVRRERGRAIAIAIAIAMARGVGFTQRNGSFSDPSSCIVVTAVQTPPNQGLALAIATSRPKPISISPASRMLPSNASRPALIPVHRRET